MKVLRRGAFSTKLSAPLAAKLYVESEKVTDVQRWYGPPLSLWRV